MTDTRMTMTSPPLICLAILLGASGCEAPERGQGDGSSPHEPVDARLDAQVGVGDAEAATDAHTDAHVLSDAQVLADANHQSMDADTRADSSAARDAATRPHRYRTAGDPCSTESDCPALPGARCLSWPSGYCTLPCEPDGACAEGICADVERAPALGLTCLAACERDRHCRPGYVCTGTIDGHVCAPAE